MLIFLSQNANCSARSAAMHRLAEPVFYSANFDKSVEDKIVDKAEQTFSENCRLARSKAFKKRSLKMSL